MQNVTIESKTKEALEKEKKLRGFLVKRGDVIPSIKIFVLNILCNVGTEQNKFESLP